MKNFDKHKNLIRLYSSVEKREFLSSWRKDFTNGRWHITKEKDVVQKKEDAKVALARIFHGFMANIFHA